MRRFLTVVFVLLICVAGLGYYRGWFDVSTAGSGAQRSITFTVDQDKIKADEQRAREQLPKMGTTTPAEPKKD